MYRRQSSDDGARPLAATLDPAVVCATGGVLTTCALAATSPRFALLSLDLAGAAR
jgi:hypothetical protein